MDNLHTKNDVFVRKDYFVYIVDYRLSRVGAVCKHKHLSRLSLDEAVKYNPVHCVHAGIT